MNFFEKRKERLNKQLESGDIDQASYTKACTILRQDYDNQVEDGMLSLQQAKFNETEPNERNEAGPSNALMEFETEPNESNEAGPSNALMEFETEPNESNEAGPSNAFMEFETEPNERNESNEEYTLDELDFPKDIHDFFFDLNPDEVHIKGQSSKYVTNKDCMEPPNEMIDKWTPLCQYLGFVQGSDILKQFKIKSIQDGKIDLSTNDTPVGCNETPKIKRSGKQNCVCTRKM